MKIVIDKDIPFLREALAPFAETVALPGREIAPEDVADADALIVRTRTRCDRQLLGGSSVRFVGTATIGFDHIDRTWCAAHGIEVATAAGCNARGVLQWVGACLTKLSLDGGWTPPQRCLGVVGVGHIGSLVADYAARWGFRVLCCDPPRRRLEPQRCGGFVSLEEIASRADIVTFHVPMNRSGEDCTWHMADERFIARLRPGAVLLNSSRGAVVDNRALRDAVLRGTCGCCLDVWENEPDIDPLLLEKAVVATPHIAGYSLQGKANASAMMAEALARRFGLPLTGWYPDVKPSSPRPISWQELRQTVAAYCDTEAESAPLRADRSRFEELRNRYKYREEYF
ncbi:MAG: 4-phosphoerythronate dehydrogenase [Rikenellaceae bacterium]|nr:4-phosphoerythronate dehydrogenase [Rikenellaceae bacterium]